MHLLHQFMRLQRGDPFGRNGRQHADGDPVAPVECQVLFDQRLGSVQHHGKDLRAGLLGQREGPGLEAVGPSGNFADFSGLGKLLLSFDMLAGRLELVPMFMLFSPLAWSKKYA